MKFSKKTILIICIILLFFVSLSAISAHDSNAPSVIIDNPSPNSKVSENVEINAIVDDHYETKYVNFTIDGIDNASYTHTYQDNNPTNGWSYIWDTSNVANGRYYIQAKAINSLGLTGDYNIIVTVNNVQKDTLLTVENTTIGIDQSNNIIFRLTDKDGNPLANKELYITISSVGYTAMTNYKGLATISYMNSKSGIYDIEAKFIGDNRYIGSQGVGTITVIPSNIIQIYGSYIGGNGNDKGKGAYIDKDGNIYLAIETNSSDLNATQGAYQNYNAGKQDLFISKFSAKGELIFSTYLGGSDIETLNDLKISENGDIYLVGSTCSINLPVSDNGFQKKLSGIQDGFLLVLNSNGDKLNYGTYIGGSKFDSALAVCVYGNNAYIQGVTNSINFPVTINGYQTIKNGIDWDINKNSTIDFKNSLDLFLVQIDIQNGNLTYGTYFGGNGSENTNGLLTVDKNGILYFGSSTTSTDFPITVNTTGTINNKESKTFLTAFDINKNAVIYSSFIGGSSTEGKAIYVDKNGYLYYVGDAISSDFPNATIFNGKIANGESTAGRDIFAIKIDASNGKIIYNILLSGNLDDIATAITVDNEGNLYIGGFTKSNDFPVTEDAYQKIKKDSINNGETINNMSYDATITKISADGSKLLYSTYYGGEKNDMITGITLNNGGFILQLKTDSDDLYVSENAYQKHENKQNNSYIAIFSDPSFMTTTPVIGNTGKEVLLNATLKESMGNRFLTNKTVKFYIGDKYIGSAKTDSNGVASLYYEVAEKGGEYVYKAVFEGDLGHEAIESINKLTIPQSELYVSLLSNKSNTKVGDYIKITYTITNYGPDTAENVIYTYKIPDGLKYVDSKVDVGKVTYDSLTRTITWIIGSVNIDDKFKLDLSMKATASDRYRLTPNLTTDTYDESASNLPNRYLTVKNQTNTNQIDSNIDKYSYYSSNSYMGGFQNSGSGSGYGNAMKVAGNPIALLILCLFTVFVGQIKRR